MFRNLKIGTKLFISFGLLVVLFGAIGFVTWSKMSVVKGRASSLAMEYVPEVSTGTSVERATLMAQSDLESYALVYDVNYLQSGLKHLAETRKHLQEARILGEQYQGLVALREGTANALAALDEYQAILERGQTLIDSQEESLGQMAWAAESYMKGIEEFLSSQNGLMKFELESGISPLLVERFQTVTLANELLALVHKAQIKAYKSIADRTPDELLESEEVLKQASAKLDELDALTRTSKRQAQIEEMRANSDTYIQGLTVFHQNWKELDAAIIKLQAKAEEVVGAVGAVTAAGLSQTTEIANFTAAEVTATLSFMMIMIGIAILLAMIVAFVVTRMITRPLKTVVALSERAGSGDLTFGREDFNYDGHDELGQMADALAGMIVVQRESVKAIIAEAHSTLESAQSLAALSEETNASVEEVKSAVEQVSAMSQANSAALEETNAGVQEVSTSATSSAQASAEGASASAKTIEVARDAVGKVNNVIDDIEAVGGKSREVEQTIGDLAKSVKAISGFVNTITGIADQTNLLALNAAIEAARAGDAGRGFAVVADEVRKLAEESGKAAHEVGILITTLQSGAQKAISVTNESGSIMGQTVMGAKEAQDQLTTALAEIAKITDVMQDIAAGAQEQAAAAEQMAAGVDQVSTATVEVVEAVANIRANSDEMAKASEGVAEHAQALTEGAERMQGHLLHFRVDATAASAVPEEVKVPEP